MGLMDKRTYCPMCQKRPVIEIKGFRFYDKTYEPEICKPCRDSIAQLKAKALAAGTVEVRKIAPGESGQSEEDRQTTLWDFVGRDRSREKKRRATA